VRACTGYGDGGGGTSSLLRCGEEGGGEMRKWSAVARRLCRWSATERLRSVRQLSKPSLTAGFAIELTPYAKRFSDFFQNQSRSPKYHLQMLFNDLMLTRNIN